MSKVGMVKSVHLQLFPEVSKVNSEESLVREMDKVRDICSTSLSIRDKKNLRVRLPLGKVTVIGKDLEKLAKYEDIIKSEVNVKKIEFVNEIGDLAELRLQVNFKKLGSRFGSKMKDVIKACKMGDWTQKTDGTIEVAGEVLSGNDFEIKLMPKDPEDTAALSTNDALVKLDTNVTEELRLEGLARDIVRLIQQFRKEADLDISNRINTSIDSASEDVEKALSLYSDYISEQTLSSTLVSAKPENEDFRFDGEVDGQAVVIGFSVA